MYTFEQLKEDVRKEAEALKVHATKEERDMLDFNNLCPDTISSCVYGLMTGSCNSLRAATLIDSCACRFIRDSCPTEIRNEGFERIQRRVNGAVVEGLTKERTQSGFVRHYSAIEAYILLPEAKNANLISYLRGDIQVLEL